MLTYSVLLSIYGFEKIKNDKRKTKVIWTENQNDIHTDFGNIKLNRKVKAIIIIVRNSEESVDLLKVT
jgi:hypothetical protein